MAQSDAIPPRKEEQQAEERPKTFFKLINPFMRLILRSPLHRLISNRVMLLSFTGRKSGKRYSTPVSYTREGNNVIVVSFSPWWKNFMEPAPVEMRIRGMTIRGQGVFVRDAVRIEEIVNTLMTHDGREMMQRMGLWVDHLESLSPTEVQQATKKAFFIDIKVNGQQ